MTKKFDYSIENDFPNSLVVPHVLSIEIKQSSITAGVKKINTNEGTDACEIEFNDDLTGVEETTLDGIVATHKGDLSFGELDVQAINRSSIYAYNSATQTFTSEITANFDKIMCSSIYLLGSVDGGLEVTLTVDGWYGLSYDMSVDISGTGRSGSSFWIESNGVLVPGTRAYAYHRTMVTGKQTASCHTIAQLESGDVIRVRMIKYSGSGILSTIANACRLYIDLGG